MAKNTITSAQVDARVQEILDERFVKTEKVSRVLSAAFQTNMNAILFGPAGHGKSEMLELLTNTIIAKRCDGSCDGECDNKSECRTIPGTFVQSFGEGMDEAQLWGGIDFKRFDESRELVYAPHRSFLNYECAIFEDLFDAPASVLLSLKDTLTARELRKGKQRYKMKTRCIIALTNRDPSSFGNLGPAAHALIERFPLQYNMKWDSYESKDFRAMFNKRYPRKYTDVKEQLSEICAVAVSKGAFISPRTAMHALDVCIANEDRGDETYDSLRFVRGFEGVMDNIKEEIHQANFRREAV